MAQKTFRVWEIDQIWMLPPTVRDLVPQNHLAHFVRDLVVQELDLSALFAHYQGARGQPPYHPAMMTALLLYAYSRGVYSSRRIERACEERVDFMAVTARSKPDHDTICTFRNVHREALRELFVQVLGLCRDAGMTKLGHVALDGTKMKANASKHRAMSYKRMKEKEPELATEVEKWLETAQATDEAEEDEHGRGRRGDELPAHVRAKAMRLAQIRASMARLESEAKANAERIAAERAAREKELGHGLGGVPPQALEGIPEDKAQSNFTDSESRIMKTANGYEQAYNCQAAVDAVSQVIVAQSVAAKQNDSGELMPLVDQMEENVGMHPAQVSADSNYWSEENLAALEERTIDAYVATGRQRQSTASATSNERARAGPYATKMREKLEQGGHESPYRLRKQTVEPVFGQIKEARGFRQFLRRGLDKVAAEWALVCTVHNLLKLSAIRLATEP